MERYTVGLSEEEARATLARHRYQPLEDWPGATGRRWRVQCLKCGAKLTLTVGNLRYAPVRTRCHHRASSLTTPSFQERLRLASQLQPAPPKPKKETKKEPKKPPRRATDGPLTEEGALKELAQHKYTPVGPYPGNGSAPWHVRCDMCEAELWVKAATLRQHPLRKTCRHAYHKIIVPSRARREAHEQRFTDTP